MGSSDRSSLRPVGGDVVVLEREGLLLFSSPADAGRLALYLRADNTHLSSAAEVVLNQVQLSESYSQGLVMEPLHPLLFPFYFGTICNKGTRVSKLEKGLKLSKAPLPIRLCN